MLVVAKHMNVEFIFIIPIQDGNHGKLDMFPPIAGTFQEVRKLTTIFSWFYDSCLNPYRFGPMHMFI